MHDRLINYLRDNRDHIIENWLTEADLPLPEAAIPFDGLQGTVPLAFLLGAFDRVIARISGEPCNCNGHGATWSYQVHNHNGTHHQANSRSESSTLVETESNELRLDDFLNRTCACKIRRLGGRVCIELHDSGLRAFKTVFEDGWDADEDFGTFERQRYIEIISNALASVFGDEVEGCQHRHARPDCPFNVSH